MKSGFSPKEAKNSIFILVSDDITWAEEHLLNVTHDTIVSSYGIRKAVSLTETEVKALDLALLWSCNYTVFDYGTFGFWGSFLSGADVGNPAIAAVNASQRRRTTEEMNLLRAELPNFTFIE